MTPEEKRKMRQANFRQTNAYAMQNGIFLGLIAIANLASFVIGLAHPIFMLVSFFFAMAFPLVALGLTLRFRQEVALGFPFAFARGFSHTLLAVLYAGVWAGVATLLYMAFFDKGYIFDQYLSNINQSEVQKTLTESGLLEQIKQSTGGLSLQQMIEQLRKVSAATYAAMVMYFYIFSSPILAVLGGFLALRRPRI